MLNLQNAMSTIWRLKNKVLNENIWHLSSEMSLARSWDVPLMQTMTYCMMQTITYSDLGCRYVGCGTIKRWACQKVSWCEVQDLPLFIWATSIFPRSDGVCMRVNIYNLVAKVKRNANSQNVKKGCKVYMSFF